MNRKRGLFSFVVLLLEGTESYRLIESTSRDKDPTKVSNKRSGLSASLYLCHTLSQSPYPQPHGRQLEILTEGGGGEEERDFEVKVGLAAPGPYFPGVSTLSFQCTDNGVWSIGKKTWGGALHIKGLNIQDDRREPFSGPRERNLHLRDK